MRSSEDRRKVLVSLLPRGIKLVEKVARDRISELRSSGVKLVTAIDALLEPRSQAGARYAAASRLANSPNKKSRPAKKGKSFGK
jgi:DNA-binding MarR family transcriptional regulator